MWHFHCTLVQGNGKSFCIQYQVTVAVNLQRDHVLVSTKLHVSCSKQGLSFFLFRKRGLAVALRVSMFLCTGAVLLKIQ